MLRVTHRNGISISPPPVIGFQDDFTLADGGTGRFATASGGGTEIGSIDVTAGFGPGAPFSVRMDGVISYRRG